MCLSVIAVNGLPARTEGAAADKMIAVRAGFAFFLQIFQCVDNLEGGAGRIHALRGAVQKSSGGTVAGDLRPVLPDGIRIIIRAGNAGENPSCGNLRHNDGAFVNAECIPGSLLKLRVQCRHHVIAGIFLSAAVIFRLLGNRQTRLYQVPVFQSFHAAAPQYIVSDDLGKK